jgi:hypothetical protein
MKRNSKLIFGGKSGGYINKLFEAKGFDREGKSLLLFLGWVLTNTFRCVRASRFFSKSIVLLRPDKSISTL